MDVLDAIRPEVLENWPVLDEEPAEGIVVWMQLEEDFLGHRVAVRFPRLPSRRGETARSLNTPITLPCEQRKPGFLRYSWWVVLADLWSESERCIKLTNGCRLNPPVSLGPGDSLTIQNYVVWG